MLYKMITYTVTKNTSSITFSNGLTFSGNQVYYDSYGVYYTLSTSTAYVVGYTSVTDGASIIIPDAVNDGVTTYTITSISDSAFKNSKITGVTFGANLQSIGANAFYLADKLANINWGDSNPTIGANAFNSILKFSYKSKSFIAGIESISLTPFKTSGQYGFNSTVFSVSGLPSELSFSRVTGKISSNGKFSATAGTYLITVSSSSRIYRSTSTTVSITIQVLSELTPEQISALTIEQIAALTPEQIQTLTIEQIPALTTQQIQAFTAEQIAAFT